MVTPVVVVLPVRVHDPVDPEAGYPAFVELDRIDRIELIHNAAQGSANTDAA